MHEDLLFRAEAMRAYRDHVASTLGLRTPAVTSGAELIDLVKKTATGDVEAKYGWRTEPPYPGLREEPEEMPTGWRMICACRLFDDAGIERGVVFTTFISSKPVAVFVNHAGAVIPDNYKPLALR
jgi:hypothetical protein